VKLCFAYQRARARVQWTVNPFALKLGFPVKTTQIIDLLLSILSQSRIRGHHTVSAPDL